MEVNTVRNEDALIQSKGRSGKLQQTLNFRKEEQKEVILGTPAKLNKRMSENGGEKTELKNLLREKFIIPANSGSLPQAKYNSNNHDTWVYPASKTFRTYQFKIVRTSLF